MLEHEKYDSSNYEYYSASFIEVRHKKILKIFHQCMKVSIYSGLSMTLCMVVFHSSFKEFLNQECFYSYFLLNKFTAQAFMEGL